MVTVPSTKTVRKRPERWYDAQIGDVYVRFAAGPDRRLDIEPAQLEAARVNTTGSAEEIIDSFGQVFARSDFSAGEGLDRAHVRDAEPRDDRRFYDSRNVDVGEAQGRRHVTLLHTTELIDGSVAATQRLAWNGTRLFVTASTTVRSAASPLSAAPLFVDDNPYAGEVAVGLVAGLAALGTDVYAALGGNGIHRKTGAGWAHYNDLAADGIWQAKGRIVASAGRSLYEIAAAGPAPSPLRTLAPGQTWTDVTDAGQAILAAASDGYLYAFAPGAAGTLELVGQSLVEGEAVTCVTAVQGVVLYGTSEPAAAGGTIGRLYRAELGDGGVLTNKLLVVEWGDARSTVDRAPHAITGTRTSAFTVVREDTGEAHAWRYDLVHDGIIRSYVFAAPGGGGAFSALTIGGRFVTAISGSGVWRQSTEYAPEGWLIGPLGDFFTAAEKAWVGARLDVDASDGGVVELHFATEPAAIDAAGSALWRKVRVDGGELLADETPIAGVESRFIAGQVRLFGGGQVTPRVRSFGFRAYPTPSDLIVTMPVSVSDQVETRNRRAFRVPGRGEAVFRALLDLEGQSSQLTVFRPRITVRGLVEAVGTPIPVLSERGSVTHYSVVRFRGRRTTLSTTRPEGTFGVVTVGVEGFGGG